MQLCLEELADEGEQGWNQNHGPAGDLLQGIQEIADVPLFRRTCFGFAGLCCGVSHEVDLSLAVQVRGVGDARTRGKQPSFAWRDSAQPVAVSDSYWLAHPLFPQLG